MGKKHTLESCNLVLNRKKIGDFLSVVKIEQKILIVLDKDYGEYKVDVKCLSPKTNFPFHKLRKQSFKLKNIQDKYIGKIVNDLKIVNVFYGPDNGYKNRSFYLEYIGKCGHTGIGSYATISRHKKNFICQSCTKTVHGERKKIDGVLKKRTATYIYWVSNNKNLPEKYRKNFYLFKNEAGNKPNGSCRIELIDNKLCWISSILNEDRELNMISMAIRQAFRHSSFYKKVLEDSRVETEEGTRYRCAHCSLLFKRKEVQVDHIDPINPIQGNGLDKLTLIDRIWTKNIQILDKKCHNLKSKEENKIRRERKLLIKNEIKI